MEFYFTTQSLWVDFSMGVQFSCNIVINRFVINAYDLHGKNSKVYKEL